MKTLITGGAGFVGTNLANYLLEKEENVVIFDDLSRKGTEKNLAFLKEKKGNLKIVIGDIRDYNKVQEVVKGINQIYHFAAQVAVTTSLDNPKEDFEINTGGTLNILEAMRKKNPEAVLFFSSTNKVYGEMANIPVVEKERRYTYKNIKGISESYPLDFYSPYGCSKGAADSYVRDYSRIYGLKTVVFRCSCLYGPHQFGNEDQGWVSHLAISAYKGENISIYGDGKQVRDVLYVDDLIAAFQLASEKLKTDTKYRLVYNIGGGSGFTLSILELISELERLLSRKVRYKFSDWRPGDQKVYISDISKAKRDFNWQPKINPQEGVKRLLGWIKTQK